MMNPTAKYIMVGGFLGAGKTTAIAALARHFSEQGNKVGLITNDQGSELVDTAMLRSRGFATEEISGGCFCCRFNSLVEAASRLTQSTRPDLFIAEPVGSCTDLVATVSYPLRRIYGEHYRLAPLSVLVDPVRARRVLGLEEGRGFSPKVTYIYRKQLEEADCLVITKADLLKEGEEEALRAALEEACPHARIFTISSREGTGLIPWMDYLNDEEAGTRRTLEVDYDLYAEGEALLGWLNATLEVRGSQGQAFDATDLTLQLTRKIADGLAGENAEVAHLKLTFSPERSLSGDVAVVNQVRGDLAPEVGQSLDAEVEAGQIILNLRAEADPEQLSRLVQEACASFSSEGFQMIVDHLEHFRPGRPVPTHRDVVMD